MGQTPLQRELNKATPFESLEQETFLSLYRTSGMLAGDFQVLFKTKGLSFSTYNVLRIVAGAGDEGRPSQSISEDMVVRVPDVTRLVDRLQKQGFVERKRCDRDRRVIFVRITEQGRELLDDLRGPVDKLHIGQLAHMTETELRELTRLLARARKADEE
ncbi:MAG: MarR family transcriptional regulator [Planctomycetota bacterium]